jgi:hypothetical protein
MHHPKKCEVVCGQNDAQKSADAAIQEEEP